MMDTLRELRPNIDLEGAYANRSEDVQAAFEHLPNSPYAFDDKPFLNTQRYSMSGYELRDVQRKLQVDLQGALDMQYSLHQWKQSPERKEEAL